MILLLILAVLGITWVESLVIAILASIFGLTVSFKLIFFIMLVVNVFVKGSK